jgi:O-antigen/teichoic acid export membrane protein
VSASKENASIPVMPMKSETSKQVGLAAEVSRRSLKGRILRAGSWTMVAHFLGQGLRLISSLVMTRLLVPEMFGVMALATMVQVILALLSDIGLRQAIIQSPRGDQPILLNTAWTVQVVRGLVIWLVCVAIAAMIYLTDSLGWLGTSVYSAPDLPGVLAAASFAAVITGFQSTKLMTANRDLDMKRMTAIELMSQVGGLIVSGLLGWLTRSIWSFVIGALAAAMITTVFSHLSLRGMSNRFTWDKASVRELLGYGRWVLLSSLLFVLAANGDRLLLGAWVDATTLGIYMIALNLATMIEGAGARLFASVAMPALSELAREEPKRLSALYFRMRLPFDLAFIGCAGVLFAMGPFLVHLLYDHRYDSAGHMLQLLSFSLIFARYGLTGSAYLALGEPRYLMWIHAVKVVSIFCLTPVLYSVFGLDGALLAIAFHNAPTLPLVYWFGRKHHLNDLKFEGLVLLIWPLGYAFGLMTNHILSMLK